MLCCAALLPVLTPAAGRLLARLQIGVVLMKLLADSAKIDVRRPGGLVQSVPAFWHKLELGHDGSARGVWGAGEQ